MDIWHAWWLIDGVLPLLVLPYVNGGGVLTLALTLCNCVDGFLITVAKIPQALFTGVFEVVVQPVALKLVLQVDCQKPCSSLEDLSGDL